MEASTKGTTGKECGRLDGDLNHPQEGEAGEAAPREMTGLFQGLTADQKKAALSYDGPEDHGDPAFLAKRRKNCFP